MNFVSEFPSFLPFFLLFFSFFFILHFLSAFRSSAPITNVKRWSGWEERDSEIFILVQSLKEGKNSKNRVGATDGRTDPLLVLPLSNLLNDTTEAVKIFTARVTDEPIIQQTTQPTDRWGQNSGSHYLQPRRCKLMFSAHNRYKKTKTGNKIIHATIMATWQDAWAWWINNKTTDWNYSGSSI